MISALLFTAWKSASPRRALAVVALALVADLIVGAVTAAILGAKRGKR